MTLNLKKAEDDMEASIDEMERWLDGVACTLERGSSSGLVILGTHLDEVRGGEVPLTLCCVIVVDGGCFVWCRLMKSLRQRFCGD